MPQSKSKRARAAERTAEPSESLLGNLLQAVVASLLVVRLLVPTESAADGQTLWVVQFWLAAALLWAWNAIREADFRVRWDRFDLAFSLIVAGHVAGAALVFYEGGNKRAAINVSWEWVGLAVSFFLIRQTMTTAKAAKRLLTVLLTTAVCLAGLGLWQHYVFYPQTVREYDRKSSELQRLQTAEPPRTQSDAVQRSRRLRELSEWFITRDIPQQGPARVLWEQRLRSSTEPFGMFALANTFAGFLLVWLIVALSVLGRTWRAKASWQQLALSASAAALLAYCLILTKSRTAWVGLCAAFVVWGALATWRIGLRWKTWLWSAAAVVALLIAMLAAAALGGGFDRAVVAEAPKSFHYRLLYWSGTAKVLRERPVFGTGPGNFRQHYLRQKRPESSEAIADPHNFLLDLWANGGIIAVVGLLACLAAVVHSVRRREEKPGRSDEAGTRPDGKIGFSETAVSLNAGPERASAWDATATGGSVAFVAAFVATVLVGEVYDLRLPVLLLASILLYLAYGRISNSRGFSGVCLIAAGVGLFVHLLGAGGMEMPAVVQTFLVLFAAGSVRRRLPDTDRLAGSHRESPPANRGGTNAARRERDVRHAARQDELRGESGDRSGLRGVLFLGGLFVVLFVGCFFSATKPVLNGRSLLSLGEYEQMFGGGAVPAARLYAAAASADPFSPDAPRRFAELKFLQWQSLPGDAHRDFKRAVEAMNVAIELDPFDYGGYWQLGRWYRQRFQRTGERSDAVDAARALRRAVERYPTHAALRADLAGALADAGNLAEARNEAAAALRQDAVNRSWGHRDTYLSRETMIELAPSFGAFSGRRAGERPR